MRERDEIILSQCEPCFHYTHPTFHVIAGSFQFYTQLPEKEKEETDKKKRKELSEVEEEEEEMVSSVKKKKKKLLRRSLCEDDEEQQPGPSSQLTPRGRKKPGKVCPCKSPLMQPYLKHLNVDMVIFLILEFQK